MNNDNYVGFSVASTVYVVGGCAGVERLLRNTYKITMCLETVRGIQMFLDYAYHQERLYYDSVVKRSNRREQYAC